MIRVVRRERPRELAVVRKRELRKLRRIAAERPPAGDEITGYAVARDALWKAQHYKCCYCEQKLKEQYNDVEHYRPKARANRNPGSADTHGYWWLAFTWENLLFACPSCNRSAKNDCFPLSPGDTALAPGEKPPGREQPYLLDPAARDTNPVEHIQFCLDPRTNHWRARPRGGSVFGEWTICVCDLNEHSLLELRSDHVRHAVRPLVDALQDALSAADRAHIEKAFQRCRALLAPACPYVALSYDALRHFIASTELEPWGLSWPEPKKVGLPARRSRRKTTSRT